MTTPASTTAIIATAAALHGIRPSDVTSLSRTHRVVQAKRCAAWMMRTHRGMSYWEIARAVGWESHSAAHDAVRRTRAMLEESLVMEAA